MSSCQVSQQECVSYHDKQRVCLSVRQEDDAMIIIKLLKINIVIICDGSLQSTTDEGSFLQCFTEDSVVTSLYNELYGYGMLICHFINYFIINRNKHHPICIYPSKVVYVCYLLLTGINNPPVITCPQSFSVTSLTGNIGGLASWDPPTCVDQEDGNIILTNAACNPASQAFFQGTGINEVTCSCTDSQLITTQCTFFVTVEGK